MYIRTVNLFLYYDPTPIFYPSPQKTCMAISKYICNNVHMYIYYTREMFCQICEIVNMSYIICMWLFL